MAESKIWALYALLVTLSSQGLLNFIFKLDRKGIWNFVCLCFCLKNNIFHIAYNLPERYIQFCSFLESSSCKAPLVTMRTLLEANGWKKKKEKENTIIMAATINSESYIRSNNLYVNDYIKLTSFLFHSFMYLTKNLVEK